MKPSQRKLILQQQSEALQPPSGFTLPVPFQIRRQGNRYTHNFDVADYKPTGQNYYVDVENGSDDNDGLTIETAFKTITKAITAHGSKTDVASVSSAVISPSTDWASSGTHSFKVRTPGVGIDEGIKRAVNLPVTTGNDYTTTAKVMAPIGAKLKIVFGTSATVTITEQPQTLSLTYTATSSPYAVGVRTATDAQAISFYVDDWEVVDNANPTVNLLTPYMNSAEPCIINLADGFYNKTNGFNNSNITCPTAILSMSGNPTISAENDQSWSLTEGKTNTYQSTEETTVLRVFDSSILDTNGDYTEYTLKTSVDEVEATAGSWYQTGGIIYVHTTDNRTPDLDIHPYIAVKQVYAANVDLYLEGLKIYGGSGGSALGVISHISNVTPSKLYIKDCEIKYSVNDNKGLYVALSNAYLQNILSSKNQSDAFNYHFGATAFEVDCVGRCSGYTGKATENGSTTHEAGKILRLNGLYYDNYGPNIADVNANTQSWSINCLSRDSKAADTGGVDFYIATGNMWLENCNNQNSLSVYGLTSASGVLALRRNRVAGAVSGSYLNY